MEKEYYQVATETLAYNIGGQYPASGIKEYKCCTVNKAYNCGCKYTPFKKYYNWNQLVNAIDCKSRPRWYDYYFTYTFFFEDSRLCVPNSSRIKQGVGFIGSNGYIDIDSDLAQEKYSYIHLYKLASNNNIQAISTTAAVPKCFEYSYTTISAQELITKYSTTDAYIKSEELNVISYSNGGFDINGDILPNENYVTYVSMASSIQDSFSDYEYYKVDENINLEPTFAHYPYHIWVFENQYLANLLLGNDINSYE